jgi:HEAT repeat protein
MKRLSSLAYPFLFVLVAMLALGRWWFQPRVDGERLPTWLKRLDDANPAVRARAVQAVAELGHGAPDKVIPALTNRVLHEPDGNVRRAALEALTSSCDLSDMLQDRTRPKQTAVRSLLDALHDDDPEVRARVPAALTQVLRLHLVRIRSNGPQDGGEPEFHAEAVEALCTASKDPDERVRKESLTVLVRRPFLPAAAEPGALLALRSKDVATRRLAGEAIASVRGVSATAFPSLAAALGDPDEMAARWAGIALRKAGQPAVPALLTALAQGNLKARKEAALILAFSRPPAKVRPSDAAALVKLLASPDREVRTTSQRLLQRLGTRSLPALTAAVRQGPAEVRWQAATVLAALGPTALPTLDELKADEDEQVRQAARAALLRLAAPTLLALAAFGASTSPSGPSPLSSGAILAYVRARTDQEKLLAQLGGILPLPKPER